MKLPALRRLARARLQILLLVLVAALALPVTAEALAWRDYRNSKYGYAVNIPDRYLLVDSNEVTDDGVTLKSRDGDVVVQIFGTANTTRLSLREVVAKYRAGAPGSRFTYERRGHGWAVLSGYEGDDIFYVRIAMSRDRERVAILAMTYAKAVKRRLDPIVTRMSRSLRIR